MMIKYIDDVLRDKLAIKFPDYKYNGIIYEK